MSESKTDRTRGKTRTIVGGRPRERRQGRGGGIPRGIEVLVKKASLDPAFCQLLLGRRAGAAAEIGLELTLAEKAILDAVPEAQLKAMVESTKVPDLQRRAFLGQIGAAMLAAVTSGCYPPTVTITKQVEGIRPEGKVSSTPTPQHVEKEILVTRILGHVVEGTATFTPTPIDTLASPPASTPNPEDTPTAPPAATSIQPETENRDTPAPGPVVRGIRPDRP